METIIPNHPMDIDSYMDFTLNSKKEARRLRQLSEDIKNAEAAKMIADKILAENPHLPIGHLIEYFQNMILSTTKCSIRLGISPSAFNRLRKKYNIIPVYRVVRNKTNNSKFNRFSPGLSRFSVRNYYTPQQLQLIPQSEIDLVQLRAARSLKFPNGIGKPWKWFPRGLLPNGKLRARTNNLDKIGFYISYMTQENMYYVKYKGNIQYLSKQEVDRLNTQYGKLKAFL